jgi:hypothetical protein
MRFKIICGASGCTVPLAFNLGRRLRYSVGTATLDHALSNYKPVFHPKV